MRKQIQNIKINSALKPPLLGMRPVSLKRKINFKILGIMKRPGNILNLIRNRLADIAFVEIINTNK